ncbi:putative dCK/dGK-like deoxyribonucleoside kinase [Oryza sativa Japonica Group]|uniref:DCK/dGK-like deoxyribonucleoside kinase n=1 Tax=Oryza sativa subsp. japonica TaxID=39947 RepID=Q5N728_ORYSJ|nr:putative dCK/dGK-like deoxyribonucleoside kinase [Oryza sativa Japonica Group]
MVEFLQSSVGIIHKNHAESITLFIKESVDEELKGTDSPNVSKNKRLTFCVEGNISVGKTTFLQRIANETIELRDLVEIVPEPIAKWQDVGPDHFNILDAFYAEPQRYAYTFQNYVFVTRLRASPDTCHKRMMVRKRSEEGGVTLDYLRGLHEKHESWLLPSKGQGPGVLSVSQVPVHMEGSLPPDIRERVFYLEGDHMHSSIQKVPALVLDCEHDIDFNKDIEAKRQYARQVAEFFEFVKKKKEDPSAESSGGDKSTNKQIMLPHRGGLWVPEGNPLPGSALNSLDFRRAMSSFLSA